DISGRTLPGIRTILAITIQSPSRATIESAPATTAHVNARIEIRRRRSELRRVSEVLRGAHLPLRYSNISHNRIAMSGTAHGIAVPVLRFATTSADQSPCGIRAIANPR